MPLRARVRQLRPLLSESYYSVATYLGAFALMGGLWFCLASYTYGESLPLTNGPLATSTMSSSGVPTVSPDIQSGSQLHSQAGQKSPTSIMASSGFISSSPSSVAQRQRFIPLGNESSSTPSPAVIPSSPTPDTTTVKVAIIGAIGLVLSVTIPVLASTFNRQRLPNRNEQETPVEKELRRRAEAAERLVDEKNLEIKRRSQGAYIRDQRIEDLETLLWSHGIDPATPLPPPHLSPLPRQEIIHDS